MFIFNLGVCNAENIPLVRVGISDTNFKSLLYKNTELIATDDFALYDKSTSQKILSFLFDI